MQAPFPLFGALNVPYRIIELLHTNRHRELLSETPQVRFLSGTCGKNRRKPDFSRVSGIFPFSDSYTVFDWYSSFRYSRLSVFPFLLFANKKHLPVCLAQHLRRFANNLLTTTANGQRRQVLQVAQVTGS